MDWEDQLRDFGNLFDRYEHFYEILAEQRICPRIFYKDSRIWKDIIGSSEYAERCLDWTDSLTRLSSVTSSVKPPPTDTDSVVLIGTGGASLAAKACSSLPKAGTARTLQVLDSTSPNYLHQYFKDATTSNSYYIVASKSGSTIETLDLAMSLFDQVNRPERFCVITDPTPSPLKDWAEQNSIGVYSSDPFVPGRFSSLSPLGLIPIKVLGCNLEEVRMSHWAATKVITWVESETPKRLDKTAALIAALASEAGSRLVITSDPNLQPVMQWQEQLVAESLGKFGMGVLPVPSFDRPDDMTEEQICTSIQLPGLDSVEIERSELTGLDVITAHFIFWQTVVTMCGYLLRIDPFNQPNVERSKQRVREILHEADSAAESEPDPDCTLDESGESVNSMRSILAQIREDSKNHHYIGLLVFADPDPYLLRHFSKLAERVSDLTGLSTVFNFGPQYLHSTGQFHKGGPAVGHFLVIGVEDDNDIQVHDRPYTFGKIFNTQRLADMEVLRQSDRPVYNIKIKLPIEENIVALLDNL